MSGGDPASTRPETLGLPSETGPSRCRYCRSTLQKEGAPYCKECNHWQVPFGWVLPQLRLGDLALYGSIAVVLFATFDVALFGKKAELVATPLSCGNRIARLYVSNNGNDQAIMTKATLQAVEGSFAGPRLEASLTVVYATDNSPRIPLGEGRFVELKLKNNDVPDFPGQANMNSDVCVVRSTITAVVKTDGSTEPGPITETCKCSELLASG